MAMSGATLTMPGIAGLVLTVGMAIDANVIIYERIRDELRAGKLPRAAIRTGFNKALWTVLDANITTLLAGLVLFQYGTGPIKGFAVTLCIGIVTSVFTALAIPRLLFDIYPGNRPVQSPVDLRRPRVLELIRSGTNYDFIGKWKICVAGSLGDHPARHRRDSRSAGCAGASTSPAAPRCRCTSPTASQVDEGKIRDAVESVGVGEPSVVRYGEVGPSQTFLIRFQGAAPRSSRAPSRTRSSTRSRRRSPSRSARSRSIASSSSAPRSAPSCAAPAPRRC